jgi:homoserine trans-succinylase
MRQPLKKTIAFIMTEHRARTQAIRPAHGLAVGLPQTAAGNGEPAAGCRETPA